MNLTFSPTTTTIPLPQPCHATILDDVGILPTETYEFAPRQRSLGDSHPLVSPGIVDGTTLLSSTMEVMVGNVTPEEYTINKGEVLGYISVLQSPAISNLDTDVDSAIALASFIADSESSLPSVNAVAPNGNTQLDYHPVIVIQPDFGGFIQGINSAVASDGKPMKVVLMLSYDEDVLQANLPMAPDAVLLTMATDIDSSQLANSILSRIDQSVHALLPFCTAFIGQTSPASKLAWSGRVLEHYSASRSLALFESTLQRLSAHIAWTAFLHPSMKDFIPKHRYPFMTTVAYADVANVANSSNVLVVSTFPYPSFTPPTSPVAPASLLQSLRNRVAYKLTTTSGYDMPANAPLCTIPLGPLTLSRVDGTGTPRPLSLSEQGAVAGVPSNFNYPRSTMGTPQLFAGISSTAPAAFVRLLAQAVPICSRASPQPRCNPVVVTGIELKVQIQTAAIDRYAHQTAFLDIRYTTQFASPASHSKGDAAHSSSF